MFKFLLFSRVKWPGREADHSPATSAIFLLWCLFKYEIYFYGVVFRHEQGQLYLSPLCMDLYDLLIV
jgi:hypothetical protein